MYVSYILRNKQNNIIMQCDMLKIEIERSLLKKYKHTEYNNLNSLSIF